MAELGSDRRAHRRADVMATAVMVREGATIGRFIVHNLSAGGAMLTGSHEVGSGGKVQLVLEIPNRPPLRVAGEVVRCVRAIQDMAALAVAFRHRRQDTEDAIQDAVLNALLAAERPGVLVMEDDPEIRGRIGRELGQMGRRVVFASTPLDAVRVLEDPREWVDTVMIDAALNHAEGLDLLVFVAEEYPTLRRIVLQRRDPLARPPLAKAPATALFVEPWDTDGIRQAVVA